MTPTSSVVQANFSKTSQSIKSKRLNSNVYRPESCFALSNRKSPSNPNSSAHGLPVNHLWNVTEHNNFKAMKCLERDFTKYGDSLDYYIQLKNGAFEGLYDCVFTHFIEWMED